MANPELNKLDSLIGGVDEIDYEGLAKAAKNDPVGVMTQVQKNLEQHVRLEYVIALRYLADFLSDPDVHLLEEGDPTIQSAQTKIDELRVQATTNTLQQVIDSARSGGHIHSLKNTLSWVMAEEIFSPEDTLVQEAENCLLELEKRSLLNNVSYALSLVEEDPSSKNLERLYRYIEAAIAAMPDLSQEGVITQAMEKLKLLFEVRVTMLESVMKEIEGEIHNLISFLERGPGRNILNPRQKQEMAAPVIIRINKSLKEVDRLLQTDDLTEEQQQTLREHKEVLERQKSTCMLF